MHLLIKKATITTRSKAIQLDGSYLKTKFCSKFSLDKISSYKQESLYLTQLSHREHSKSLQSILLLDLSKLKMNPSPSVSQTTKQCAVLCLICKRKEGEEIVIFPLSHSRLKFCSLWSLDIKTHSCPCGVTAYLLQACMAWWSLWNSPPALCFCHFFFFKFLFFPLRFCSNNWAPLVCLWGGETQWLIITLHAI